MYTADHKVLKRGATLLFGLSACLFSYAVGVSVGSTPSDQTERRFDEMGKRFFEHTMRKISAEDHPVNRPVNRPAPPPPAIASPASSAGM